MAAERDAVIVPSYEHADIIAGQGTVGLEIAKQSIAGHAVDQVIIPCGGGGLTSGSAVALQSLLPDIRIYTAEPEHYDDTLQSLQRGERVSVPTDVPVALRCAANQFARQTDLRYHADLVTDGFVVSEAEVKAAMRFAFRN